MSGQDFLKSPNLEWSFLKSHIDSWCLIRTRVMVQFSPGTVWVICSSPHYQKPIFVKAMGDWWFQGAFCKMDWNQPRGSELGVWLVRCSDILIHFFVYPSWMFLCVLCHQGRAQSPLEGQNALAEADCEWGYGRHSMKELIVLQHKLWVNT